METSRLFVNCDVAGMPFPPHRLKIDVAEKTGTVSFKARLSHRGISPHAFRHVVAWQTA
ncbi:hypothetical protein GCM10007874_06790 [Labrys miyagiensis]|uniref:Uncharacterized protein n=1 Tax=Labrys miyagiensis TaxID=346912 RepID=A0ABQ6CBU8_9HYPH|nr:hypothetical protein GCM10007874_06790 [Labrys miyagiensis]